MLLRARIVLPITAPPIEDGAVLISENRLLAVGAWSDLRPHVSEVPVDLGEVVLLPGLINAHCHLDYTHMAGKLPPPREFTDWIKSILALKAHWSYTDYAASWVAGAQQLLASGATTVANIEAVPEMLAEVRAGTPLRVSSFLELTGVRGRKAPEDMLDEAEQVLDSLPVSRGGVGLSPHAPYSTRPELLELAAQRARRRGWRVCTHVAESRAEFEMFTHARGPMFAWLKSQRPMDDCGGVTPVQHLSRHGLLADNLLAIHANHLGDEDAALLARQGVTVVHCPRSHAYFRHAPFPRAALEEAGVNLALGTDSLASTFKERGKLPVLSLFAEMAALATADPLLSPKSILEMATLNGARALGLAGQLGELRAEALADVIAVSFNGPPKQLLEHLIHRVPKAGVVMIDGEWALPPP